METITLQSSATPSQPSGSGGSGGGGGGAGAFYVCNSEWQCDGWSACSNSFETRSCNLVKVAQHAQSTQCPSLSNPPETARRCESIQQSEQSATIQQTETAQILNSTETAQTQGGRGGITGAAIATGKAVKNTGLYIIIGALLGYYIIYRMKHRIKKR